MRWQGRRQSTNVEDRRDESAPSKVGGLNPILMLPLIRILFSKTGLIIVGVVLLISLITGMNPLSFVGEMIGLKPGTVENTNNYLPQQEEEELAQFSATILADTEDVWNQLLDGYREPTMVLFTNYVSSACGNASSATGPFYCPGDQKLYLDLSFFEEMANRLQAPGDFAQAYVIAHEVGHHIQNLMGTTAKIDQLRGTLSQTEFNKYSVRLELQADFLAGVWAHHSERTAKMMEPGDLQEAMNAANAIGDDRLQRQSTGHVIPDSFTHGTSKQRIKWFMLGYETGDISKGDTFAAEDL